MFYVVVFHELIHYFYESLLNKTATILLIYITTACTFVNIAYIAGKPVEVQALHMTKIREYVEMPHSPKIKGRDQTLVKLQVLLPP